MIFTGDFGSLYAYKWPYDTENVLDYMNSHKNLVTVKVVCYGIFVTHPHTLLSCIKILIILDDPLGKSHNLEGRLEISPGQRQGTYPGFLPSPSRKIHVYIDTEGKGNNNEYGQLL